MKYKWIKENDDNYDNNNKEISYFCYKDLKQIFNVVKNIRQKLMIK